MTESVDMIEPGMPLAEPTDAENGKHLAARVLGEVGRCIFY